jgi:hypothetical protein
MGEETRRSDPRVNSRATCSSRHEFTPLMASTCPRASGEMGAGRLNEWPWPLVIEKAFQIRAALDDGARPLVQLAVDPLEEWSADLHMRALFQRDFV